MKKLLLAALATAAFGCGSCSIQKPALMQEFERYSHEFYVPAPTEQSKREPMKIQDAILYFDISEAKLPNIAYKTPAYIASEFSLPKELHVWTLDDKRLSELNDASTKINGRSLNDLIGDQAWKTIDKPQNMPSGMVLLVERGYRVVRCPTGEHVLQEYDINAVKELHLVVNGTPRKLELIWPKNATPDCHPVLESRHGLPVGSLRSHYNEKHTLIK